MKQTVPNIYFQDSAQSHAPVVVNFTSNEFALPIGIIVESAAEFRIGVFQYGQLLTRDNMGRKVDGDAIWQGNGAAL